MLLSSFFPRTTVLIWNQQIFLPHCSPALSFFCLFKIKTALERKLYAFVQSQFCIGGWFCHLAFNRGYCCKTIVMPIANPLSTRSWNEIVAVIFEKKLESILEGFRHLFLV